MNDETKGAIEWLRTLDEDDRDYYDAQRILAHIDGEPARRAAAREEQREACALDAEERVGCASTYDEIRSVPLDATPLADELRTLRARVAELEAENKDLKGTVPLVEEVRLAESKRDFWKARAKKAEAQVAEAHERLDEFGMRRDGERATVVKGIAAMRERIDEYRIAWAKADAQVAALTSPVPGLAESGPYSLADVDAIEAHRGKPYARLRATAVERDALRAQVAAAREACARLVDRPWSRWAGDAGRDVLRAMDNATK